ncbi:uncharacterized protein IWZ02DRAFT_465238 [Phyllosticta citriasiana]|uniref:uncharacterized protein n=1 Tax=Phyllosticta citriasiana TaxID=595635 RepID=UPI0030FD7FF3
MRLVASICFLLFHTSAFAWSGFHVCTARERVSIFAVAAASCSLVLSSFLAASQPSSTHACLPRYSPLPHTVALAVSRGDDECLLPPLARAQSHCLRNQHPFRRATQAASHATTIPALPFRRGRARSSARCGDCSCEGGAGGSRQLFTSFGVACVVTVG